MDVFSDPGQVHTILAGLLLIAVFPAGLLAMAYVYVLGSFFDELKSKEPAVWQKIGAPGLVNMMVLPFWRFRKYFAFLPILQERASRKDGEYKHARLAYVLLKAGLVTCSLLFVLVGLTIFWMFYHDL